MQFGIASIIIKLTGLSRSHVMRILSELKKAGILKPKRESLSLFPICQKNFE